MPANAENGRPGLFSSGFVTGSEHATSRTRWRGLRRAAVAGAGLAAAHGSGELARMEESEREGKRGYKSSLATSRNSGAVNLSRRSGGTADQRRHRAFGLQMAARAARVLREAAAGRGGVQDGSGGA